MVEEGELGDGMGEGRGVAQDQGQFIQKVVFQADLKGNFVVLETQVA